MRVSGNSYTNDLVNQLQKLNSDQIRYQKQISSGLRIGSVSDDPNAATQVQSLQSDQRVATSNRRNMDTADNMLSYVSNSVDFVRELSKSAISSASVLTGDSSVAERDNGVSHLNTVIEQALDTLNASFNDEYVFSAASVKTIPFDATRDVDGNVTAVSYMGSTTDEKSFSVGEGLTVNSSTDIEDNLQFESFLNGIIALRDSMIAGDDTAMSAAMAVVEDADDGITLGQSSLGSKQQRLIISRTLQDDRYEANQNSLAGLKEADITEAVVRFQQSQTAYQGALQAASQVMQLSLFDFV